jgi:hypothetical protein
MYCYPLKRLEDHDILQLVMDVALEAISTYFDVYSSIEEHLLRHFGLPKEKLHIWRCFSSLGVISHYMSNFYRYGGMSHHLRRFLKDFMA